MSDSTVRPKTGTCRRQNALWPIANASTLYGGVLPAVRCGFRLPRRRSRVMSELPPPIVNLVPLAKSAPLIKARTNCGISAGSAEPSASTIATISPVAASNPQARALPFRTVISDNSYVGAELTGCCDRIVNRMPVHNDHLHVGPAAVCRIRAAGSGPHYGVRNDDRDFRPGLIGY